MRPLNLDYRRGNRHTVLAGWTALVLALLCVAGLWLHWLDLDARVATLRAESDAAALRSGERGPGGRPDPLQARRAAAEVSEARGVLARLAFPWERLFAAIEAATTADVAPLGIDPDPRKGSINISGEARTFAAMLGFSQRLQRSGIFETVVIQQHQVQQDDPERPVRFLIAAAWKVEK